MENNPDPHLRPPPEKPPLKGRTAGYLNPESSKQNIVGYTVLAVGLLALFTVGFMAYQKFYPPSEKEDITQNDIDSFKETGAVNRVSGNAPKENKNYKRQQSISEKEMSGLWETNLKSGKALLEIKGNTYRVVIIQGKNSPVRYYSNGNYTIEGDLVVLSPDTKIGPPVNGRYFVLTVGNMPVIAAKYKGKLIWQIPPKEVDVYVPPYHALLNLTEDKVMVWSVLE